MTYYRQLHPWCIIQRLPNLQRQVVTRYRRRNDAEAHLRILCQEASTADYTIVFDPTPDPLPASDQGTAQPSTVEG
jgi:hypothetical protein